MEELAVVAGIVLALVLAAWALRALERARPAAGAWITAALGFVAVLSVVAAQRLDEVLQALHKPGAASAGIGDVASFDADRGQAAVEAWAGASTQYVARWQLAFHLLMVIAVPALLGRLAARAWASLPEGDQVPKLGRVVAVAAWVVAPVAVLVGVLSSWALWDATQSERPEPFAFQAASALDWAWVLLTAACALLLGAIWVVRAVDRTGEREQLVRAITAVRLQIAVVVLFALLLHGPIAGEQAADAMLRWAEGGTSWRTGALTGVLVVVLSLVVLAASAALVRQDARPWRGPVPGWGFIAVGVVLGVAGGVAWEREQQLSGLVVLAVALVVYGLVALVKGRQPEHGDPVTAGAIPTALPLAVAAVPLVALGLAIQSASLGEYVASAEHDRRLLVLAGCGGVAQLLGWVLVVGGGLLTAPATAAAGRMTEAGRRGVWIVVVLLGVGLSVGITAAVLADPWWTGAQVGTVGAFAVFSIVIAVLSYLVAQPEQRWEPPPLLAALGFKRRIPILFALVAWLGASAVLDDHGYHHARVLPGPDGAQLAEPSVEDVWKRWRTRNAPALEPARGRRSVPLVLVAATGGGVRAAYWTARGLELMTAGKPGARDRLFALSGASGGSVGHAFFVAHARDETPADEDWVKERLGKDFLGPTWAWTLFADVPQAFLHLDLGKDRAAVLERAWERSLPELREPLRASWDKHTDEPLLLLTSTSVEDGCRLSVSPLAADGKSPSCLSVAHEGQLAGTEDVTDVLCRRDDLRLSTAAMLSARFPFVTPSGALDRCIEEGKTRPGTVRGVDGGYFDNTGASPVTELYPAIRRHVDAYNRRARAARRPCVRPVLVQLDNTYEKAEVPGGEARPFEPAVPLLTAVKVLGLGPGREANNRQNAAHAFGARNYARLYPVAHPGTTPPLGWTLSRISMEDMDQEYRGDDNAEELRRIEGWLSGTERCYG